jgi:hypothetical protein
VVDDGISYRPDLIRKTALWLIINVRSSAVLAELNNGYDDCILRKKLNTRFLLGILAIEDGISVVGKFAEDVVLS